jgi:hypothetical protein
MESEDSEEGGQPSENPRAKKRAALRELSDSNKMQGNQCYMSGTLGIWSLRQRGVHHYQDRVS